MFEKIKKLIKYFLVGGTAFLVEYTVFILVLDLSLTEHQLFLAQTISFCFGIVTSFIGNKYFTFKSGAPKYTRNTVQQLLRYLTLAVFNLLSSNLIIYVLIEQLNTSPVISKVITILIITAWNFIIFQKIIFSKENIKTNN